MTSLLAGVGQLSQYWLNCGFLSHCIGLGYNK